MAADKKNKSKTKVTEDKQPGFALEKLYLKDVSVEDLLKMIADSSGFNIIITNEIRKRILT